MRALRIQNYFFHIFLMLAFAKVNGVVDFGGTVCLKQKNQKYL